MVDMTGTDHRMAAFERLCRDRGLALTVQRRTIFEELLGRLDHPNVDQVYDAVRERLPGLSRTTVYRVLETLVELKAVRKVLHPDSVVRFDPNTERHHHLVCDRCGQLFDIDASVAPELAPPDVRKTGFRISDYSISFTGICERCQSQ